jgi:CheY-like chemotaxis protein
MSLRRFIATHREELIERTKARVARRSSAQPGGAELDRGVPIFLSQLAAVLEESERTGARAGSTATVSASDTHASGERGARHPIPDLGTYGFTIEQIVHDYGDVCQAVTELAVEQDPTVTSAELHTLDRCLDNAIADAITSWNERERPRGRPWAAAGSAARDTPARDQGAARPIVFVVDWDPHVRRLVGQFIGDAYAIELFDDGRAALDQARRSPPAALVTEILIPRLDGLALCRLLKSDLATEHVPVLVVSTLAADERARQSGADAFLQKPLERKRLVASLRGLTDGSRDAAAREAAAHDTAHEARGAA